MIEPIGLKELSVAQMIRHASVLIAPKLSARNTRHGLPPATLMGIRTPDRANDKEKGDLHIPATSGLLHTSGIPRLKS